MTAEKRHEKHLITFTASQPWLPINHFRPIRWVRLASQWGPSSSCRFPSTYCSHTRLSTHAAFEWYSFPWELTFVPRAQLSDTGSNSIFTPFLQVCNAATLHGSITNLLIKFRCRKCPTLEILVFNCQNSPGGWEQNLNGSVFQSFQLLNFEPCQFNWYIMEIIKYCMASSTIYYHCETSPQKINWLPEVNLLIFLTSKLK